MSFLAVLIVVISVVSIAGISTPAVASEGENEEMVLLRDVEMNEDISHLYEIGNVIDRYGRYVLLEAPEDEIDGLDDDYEIDRLKNRNKLNVKGHEFDTNEGYPNFDSELMIDEYEKGERGIYIVDMIAPVNPEWREELEEIRVDVINYQWRYAYETVMTPEQADEVEDLKFVDWVGIYQPGFKLAEDLETGMVNIRLIEDANVETIDGLESLIEVHSVTDLASYGVQVRGEVKDEDIDLKVTLTAHDEYRGGE